MTEDVEGVQTDAGSQKGSADGVSDKGISLKQGEVSDKGTTSKETQTLTQEQVNKMITDALTAKDKENEPIFKSLKDKTDYLKGKLSESEKGAQIHRETLNAFKGNIGDIDPELAKILKLAEYEARDKATQVAAQSEQDAKRHQETIDGFNSNMSQFITESGLDPNDKRIDWGSDSQTLLDKQQRILASVAKIHKAIAKDTKEELSKTVKDEIAKARKEMGLDSVDTSHPVGAAKDISKFTADDWIEKGLKEAKKK